MKLKIVLSLVLTLCASWLSAQAPTSTLEYYSLTTNLAWMSVPATTNVSSNVVAYASYPAPKVIVTNVSGPTVLKYFVTNAANASGVTTINATNMVATGGANAYSVSFPILPSADVYYWIETLAGVRVLPTNSGEYYGFQINTGVAWQRKPAANI